MHWIIQDGVFGDETAELIKHTKSYQLTKDCYVFDGENPFIVRGTTKFIKDAYMWWAEYCNMPNLLHLDKYKCSNYYLEIPEEKLLNSDFLLLPWWKLCDPRTDLFNYFNTSKLFIRPNSGEKLFTGTTIGNKWYSKELEIIQGLPSSNFDVQDLVLISSAKEVYEEVRFLMQGKNVISYGSADNLWGFDLPSYTKLAESNGYFPDDFYTIDIGMTKDGPKIVELNSFVSAGLYDMDYSLVVKAVEDFYAKN
jgi:hypothetical protein